MELYSALDVAWYLVKKFYGLKSPITHSKLQKIMYFIQASFIHNKKKLCFQDEIIFQDKFPVIIEVKNEFGIYGDVIIPDLNQKNKYNICHDDAVLINFIAENYRNYDAIDLQRIINMQEPWDRGFQNICKNLASKSTLDQSLSRLFV